MARPTTQERLLKLMRAGKVVEVDPREAERMAPDPERSHHVVPLRLLREVLGPKGDSVVLDLMQAAGPWSIGVRDHELCVFFQYDGEGL